jgi:hypothetical protein
LLSRDPFEPNLAAARPINHFGTLVLALLHVGQRVVMSEPFSTPSRLCWCQIPASQELNEECLCANHFLLGIEHDCADLRREVAQGKTGTDRQLEIACYVKATAMKLTEVATGRVRLSDELKKRILTTFLTLMNLQESLDRSANRATGMRELRPAVVTG